MECKVIKTVWGSYERWVRISLVRHYSLQTNFLNFSLLCLNRNQNMVWKGMWAAIIVEVWNHRNKFVFKNGVMDKYFVWLNLKDGHR